MTAKIGLVDTGFISEYHFNGFSSDPRCEIVGVARTWRKDADLDQQRQKLEKFAADHKIKAYDDFAAMVTSPDIDAVVVSSINPYHFEQIMSALEHGKHVLAEKPVVKTETELSKLSAKASEAGLCLMPAHNFAYRGAVLEAKQLLETGKLGKIQYGSFTQSFFCNAVVGGQWRCDHASAWGGVLMDSGTHLVYQTLQLIGKPVKVQAFTARNVFEMDDEDIASLQLQYADGTIVHLMQNWGSQHGEDIEGIKIVGSEGRIKISDALYFNGEKINPDTDYADSFKNQASAFVSFILDGKTPESNLDDAIWTLRIINAAYLSAKSDRVVNIGAEQNCES